MDFYPGLSRYSALSETENVDILVLLSNSYCRSIIKLWVCAWRQIDKWVDVSAGGRGNKARMWWLCQNEVPSAFSASWRSIWPTDSPSPRPESIRRRIPTLWHHNRHHHPRCWACQSVSRRPTRIPTRDATTTHSSGSSSAAARTNGPLSPWTIAGKWHRKGD